MQTASSRVWTRVTMYISYDNKYYTTSASNGYNNQVDDNSPTQANNKNNKNTSQKFRQQFIN